MELNSRNITLFISKYFIIFIVIVLLLGYFSILSGGFREADGQKIPIIIGDGYGYYSYLPIYALNQGGISLTGLFDTSQYVQFRNKYNIGVAIMILPFFLIAHLISLVSSYPADGFSFFYQHAAGLSGLFYAALGIYFLKRILERYFSRLTALLTLTAIVFGTPLYHYSTNASLFSHSFSFFLFTILIFYMPFWYENPESIKKTIVLGIIAGFIPMVRTVNILFLIIFILFYKIDEIKDIKKRLIFYYKNYKKVLLFLLVIFLVFMPQLLIWKLTFNQWIVYSYGSESFYFFNPKIVNVLFSVRRGLLFYSPILYFSIIGFWNMKGKINEYFVSSLIYIPILIIINASWWQWWFGACFGHRGFVESLPVFALALAAFYSKLKNRKLKIAVFVAGSLFIIYSIVQMIWYWKGLLPTDYITPISYRDIFINL